MSVISCVFLFIFVVYYAESINNGLARTPPMGWLSWEQFRCQTDCNSHPNSCINSKLYEEMADHMSSDGYLDVGYNQINIDDCWNTKQRNSNGEQEADPKRFPNGIKGVADYVHNKGLKLGLYNDIGSESCAGYTGINGHYQVDAQTFASWDIDMIKIDGCYASTSSMYKTYPEFGTQLNATKRPIIYSCSWPAYIPGHGETNPAVDHTTMAELAANCNLWRNYNDIQDSFSSIMGIVRYWRRDYNKYENDAFLNVAGPGNWNDPDMIIVGDPNLSMGEQETQFALWAIFAAPLLMSNDLRTISNKSRQLLLNKEIIDINQDSLGKQGGYISINSQQTEVVWMRQLADTKSIAIVLQNTARNSATITFQTSQIPSFVNGWSANTKFTARNLLNHTDIGTFTASFSDRIPTNSVGMYKMTISSQKDHGAEPGKEPSYDLHGILSPKFAKRTYRQKRKRHATINLGLELPNVFGLDLNGPDIYENVIAQPTKWQSIGSYHDIEGKIETFCQECYGFLTQETPTKAIFHAFSTETLSADKSNHGTCQMHVIVHDWYENVSDDRVPEYYGGWIYCYDPKYQRAIEFNVLQPNLPKTVTSICLHDAGQKMVHRKKASAQMTEPHHSSSPSTQSIFTWDYFQFIEVLTFGIVSATLLCLFYFSFCAIIMISFYVFGVKSLQENKKNAQHYVHEVKLSQK